MIVYLPYLEGVCGFWVKSANCGVKPLAISGAHQGLIEGSTKGVEGDVDRPTVSTCFLHARKMGNKKIKRRLDVDLRPWGVCSSCAQEKSKHGMSIRTQVELGLLRSCRNH